MPERIHKRLTYSNVVSTLCLFMLLGGGAYAAGKIQKDSVTSKQIKNGAVKNPDLANGAVSAGKLAPGAIAEGSLSGAQIADGSISGADVDESTLADIDALAVGGNQVKEVHWNVPTGTGVRTLVNFPGGLRIDAQCANFGDGLDMSAVVGDDTFLAIEAMSAARANDEDGIRDIDSKFESIDSADVLQLDEIADGLGGPEIYKIEILASTESGFTATVDLMVFDGSATGGCVVFGSAFGG